MIQHKVDEVDIITAPLSHLIYFVVYHNRAISSSQSIPSCCNCCFTSSTRISEAFDVTEISDNVVSRPLAKVDNYIVSVSNVLASFTNSVTRLTRYVT